jgi:hypothetical protein
MQKSDIYKVINTNNIIAYKVATTTKSQQEILDIICPMYEGLKNNYKIYKNGELIKVLRCKQQSQKNKRILDVNTGIIFETIKDMMDVLMLSRADALKLVKTSFKYKYVD